MGRLPARLGTLTCDKIFLRAIDAIRVVVEQHDFCEDVCDGGCLTCDGACATCKEYQGAARDSL
jgi:hypothetical protein